MKLFCFPYAGGSSTIFNGWQTLFPKAIKIIAIDYPGHGLRVNEPLRRSIPLLVSALFDELEHELNDETFNFYGHSLGGLVSYELAQKLQESHLPLPAKLIISGTGGPQFREKEAIAHLDDALFLSRLKTKYKGFSEDETSNQELLEYFLPILKADFALSETYAYLEKPPLRCPIAVLRSLNDTLLKEVELLGWQIHTNHKVNFFPLAGDHFSLFREKTHKEQLIKYLASLSGVF